MYTIVQRGSPTLRSTRMSALFSKMIARTEGDAPTRLYESCARKRDRVMCKRKGRVGGEEVSMVY